MIDPPAFIDGARVLEWAWSDQPFGKVRSNDGSLAMWIFGLALCRYDDAQVYRFCCDVQWECWQDQVYDSLEEAKITLPIQYRNVPIFWQQLTAGEP